MIDKRQVLWQYLSAHQKELIEDGEQLFFHAGELAEIHDYSYLVFPYAKAYEGFLKKLFFDLKFIDESTYRGDRFRIGKALNPSLEKRLRHNSIFDKLVLYCGGQELANELWQVWKKGRNLLFHYFPHNEHKITLIEAENIRDEILLAMKKALSECKISYGKQT
ncbi:hypothetical protein HYT17_00780 [Candidatus Microgenomates bacterium]|nr:hypothetical protein [Candidatus Microgenomates bacterium]